MRRSGRLRLGVQRGAALLAALLTVALVASMSAAALWQQWRAIEIEAADRTRAQATWILTGALDWARLALREDARSGGVDHLGEPWAVPLLESRLSGFLAAGEDAQALSAQQADLAYDAFLSGRVLDAQSRLNVTNLVQEGRVSEPALRSFGKLFDLLGLERAELDLLAQNLRLALERPVGGASPASAASSAANPDSQASTTQALAPQRLNQLVWLGLSAATLERLRPYIALLPVRTSVNLNTAPPEVLYAAVATLDMDAARRMAQARERQPFRTLAEAQRAFPSLAGQPDLAVGSRFFEVIGRLRLSGITVEETSLLQRDGQEVRARWRDRATQGLLPGLGLPGADASTLPGLDTPTMR